MARMARVVIPGYPHHLTQRGNRRQETFFCKNDYEVYLKLMAEWCSRSDVSIWAYCLMPNHAVRIGVKPELFTNKPVGLAILEFWKLLSIKNSLKVV